MSLSEVIEAFIYGIQQTTLLEFIAVIAGIASVWFSRAENILVYPVGLINTIIYIYLSFKGHLLGEASVNFYYTVMSIYGWILWTRKDKQQHLVLHISSATKKEWMQHLMFFVACYLIIFFSLTYLKNVFAEGAIPWADALASASAYTGMWLMTRKKVESWIWWIITNIASIPLFFVKGYVFTSVYYFVLLIMAIMGLIEWMKRDREQKALVFN
jgi:nicotinamide mononucleotide transporter